MAIDVILEEIPKFENRIGDHVIHGSNNSTIVCGTDRLSSDEASVNSGYGSVNSADGGKNSGMIHLVVGRSSKNPNFKTDKSYLYISMKSDPDIGAGTQNIENVNKIAVPSVVIKSDCIRLSSRDDIKIVTNKNSYVVIKSDGSIVIEGSDIKLGKNATERLIKGDSFKLLFQSHTHPTAVGPTGPPVQQFIDNVHLSTKKVLVE